MCRVGNKGLGLKEEEVRAVRGKVGGEGADILIALATIPVKLLKTDWGPSDREEERRGLQTLLPNIGEDQTTRHVPPGRPHHHKATVGGAN